MKKTYLVGIVFAVSLVLILSSLAFAQVINNGQNGVTVNPAGCNNCRTVSNNYGQNLFFNEQLCSDWQSFISYPPSGVTFGGCCTTHASRNCPTQGGAVYWYNSCGAQEDPSDGCPAGGSYCSGNTWITTPGGCIKDTTACITGSQGCATGGSYCGGAWSPGYYGGGVYQDRRSEPGCVNGRGCVNDLVERCPQWQTYFCDSNAPNNRYYGNGCYGAGAGCSYIFLETCQNGGNFCGGDGNKYTYSGCSSGSCTSYMSENCGGRGCTNGACNPACNPNAYLSCSGGNVHSYNSCNADEGVWEDCWQSCSSCDGGGYCAGNYCQCLGTCY